MIRSPDRGIFHEIKIQKSISSGLGSEIMLTPGQNGSEREKETE